MKQTDLDKLKQVQLEIMDEIHRVCSENSLTYYLVYGTLLGAVRHRGFIPWDVDIDIAMPRADYERFKEVCRDKLDEKYLYCDYSYTRYFMQPHALVCKKGTNVYTKYDFINPIVKNHGIYVDVFPLDKVPDSRQKRLAHSEKLKKIIRFREFLIPYSYSVNPLKRKLHHLIAYSLFFISPKAIGRLIQKEMSRFQSEDCSCLSTLAGEYDYDRQSVPCECFKKPVLCEFEGRKYFCPSDSHTYLLQMYGDYMTPPSETVKRANLELFTKVQF